MNQKQIDLTMSIIGKMIKPMEELMTTNEHNKTINEDGGKFFSIFISIMASVLATSVTNFVKDGDIAEDDFMSEYGRLLGLISLEALDAPNHRLRKESMH